ncbi:MAG: peroxiredoxin family protein [Desulfobacterales bacterium]|nr:peroxiredoxin family protein [Desulfobacterales bacterium]
MPDFTLPVYQGGTLTLSSLRGKNVLILFPRGYAAENYWCTICNYRYVELAELEKARRIREKYNLEILVVFPYAPGHRQGLARGPARAARDPSRPGNIPPTRPSSTTRARPGWNGRASSTPADFSLEKGTILAPFPILVDGERTLSTKLDLFRKEWTGSKVDQNIPAVYIVDAQGVLQFKYVSQNTVDRPGYDYLLKVLEVINAKK